MSPDKSSVIFRLTALWALCESGLGGWMHALHLPFTGFFVGAFSVIIISLISFYSSNSFRQVLRATFVVLLVKATVSPQSPPPAYIAVAFQGLMGALLFSLFSFRTSCLLLGPITMLESAWQKLLIATLVFGRSLWQALDSFFEGLMQELHFSTEQSFSFWIILIYSVVYVGWGLLLGFWMSRLPAQVKAKAAVINADFILEYKKQKPVQKGVKRRGITKILLVVFILGAISLILLKTGMPQKASYVLIRSIVVIAVLVWVVNPLFRWGMRRWAAKRSNDGQLAAVVQHLPLLQSYLGPAFRLASREKNFFARFRLFVLILLVLTLHPVHESE